MTHPKLEIVARRADDARPEEDRLEALRAGDARALEQTLVELLPQVRRWLRRLLGPRSDIDDATQDALDELAKALPKFEGRSSVSTLAHTVTVRVAYRCYGRQRRSRETTSLELVPVPLDEVDPESRAMGKEALLGFYRCLEKLHATRRVAFVLCAVEGMTPTEAAEVEGISPTAMRSRLMRAREELARLLRHDPFLSAIVGDER